MGNNITMGARVLVCQRGARHRYAVPSMLEDAGLLVALYTDSTCYSPVGRIAAVLERMGIRQRTIVALASRKPRGIDRSKVLSSDYLMLPGFLGGDSLDSVFRHWGLGKADIVYSMYGEEPDFIEWAKSRGARIIIDVFVHPSTNRIVDEEARRMFGGKSDLSEIAREDEHSKRTFELADVLLCPSEWVAQGLREFSPGSSHKVRVLPYGSSIEIAQSINNPKLGTVLFAGREPLRKGLHYLAEAAYMLRQGGTEVDVRVAGVAQDQVGWIKHRGELNCLGKIPMEQMKLEYANADVFVLPSLSEGQAGVLLEAMACGVPVIATRESGVDFEPDSGITVPVGDAMALASAIKSVVVDRKNRTRLAEGALRQAKMFSMDEWKKRLVNVVEGLG